MKQSTGLCQQLMGGTAVPGGTARALINGNMKLYIYGYTAGTGVLSAPATADATVGSNVLLCTVSNGGSNVNMAADPVAGVLQKLSSETWSGTNAATGTATFWRLQLPADVAAGNLASTTYARWQGTIGTGGTDMVVDTVALVSAAPFAVNNFYLSLVPS